MAGPQPARRTRRPGRVGPSGALDLAPGDWVEIRLNATGRSLLSLALLAKRIVEVISPTQAEQRLVRLREGESLLRSTKVAAATKMVS